MLECYQDQCYSFVACSWHVRGMFVDEVAFVGGPMVLDERKRLSHMKFEELLRLSGIENGREKQYVWGGNLEDAYWRTLCGDVLLPISPGSPDNIRKLCVEDKNRYEKYRAAIQDEAAIWSWALEDLEAAESYWMSISYEFQPETIDHP